jgi:hypothetical protein
MAKSKATSSVKKSKKASDKDIAATYNEYKFFEGQQYTGMKIGRVTNGITTKVFGKKLS